MTPLEPQRPGPGAESSAEMAGPPAFRRPQYRWPQKLWALLLVAFCMGIGFFLLIFPWTSFWESNYFGNLFAGMVPQWHLYWDNLYVRGAVSGLGVVNFYISVLEVYRLRRFARR